MGGRKARAVPTSARAAKSAILALGEGLEKRREEIERAVLARVWAIGDPHRVDEPAYQDGLKGAVTAAIGYCLAGISSIGSSPQVPPALLIQARVAAQSRVGLDTVLRRCLSGHLILTDYLIGEAQGAIEPRDLVRLLRSQALIFERLLEAVGEEYRRGQHLLDASHLDRGQRLKLKQVQRLVNGERLDPSGFDYDLERTHVGMVGRGPALRESMKALSERLCCPLLMVCPDERVAWGWLGLQGEVEMSEFRSHIEATCSPGAFLALGEPAQGIDGWRLTHRQASAALPIAIKLAKPLVRYADVALVASIRQDELLTTSLKKLYLEPLRGRGDGKTAQETLHAYFSSARNISSTAAVLGVSRQTVTTRLRAIEERIGGPIAGWATEMELAIRLDH